MIAFRLLAILIILGSLLFLPFLVSLLLGIIAVFAFRYFVELPVLFLLADMMYAVPESRFAGVTLISFFIAIIVLVLAEIAKRTIRFFSHDEKLF